MTSLQRGSARDVTMDCAALQETREAAGPRVNHSFSSPVSLITHAALQETREAAGPTRPRTSQGQRVEYREAAPLIQSRPLLSHVPYSFTPAVRLGRIASSFTGTSPHPSRRC